MLLILLTPLDKSSMSITTFCEKDLDLASLDQPAGREPGSEVNFHGGQSV